MFRLHIALLQNLRGSEGREAPRSISRKNLQNLPFAFTSLVDDLDPTRFWEEAGISLSYDSYKTSIEKLSAWHAVLDEQISHPGVSLASSSHLYYDY